MVVVMVMVVVVVIPSLRAVAVVRPEEARAAAVVGAG